MASQEGYLFGQLLRKKGIKRARETIAIEPFDPENKGLQRLSG
jgi:hypothetical protein